MQSARPIPPPKPSHLSLLSFPRLSLIEAQGHQREASQRSQRSQGHEAERSGYSVIDGGYNTSAAYVGNLADNEDNAVKEARTLYSFQGASANELSFDANTEILIYKENMANGWSMGSIPSTGQVGLLPCTYYALTASFTPSLCADATDARQCRELGKEEIEEPCVEPQTTGWQFGSLVRNSVLGGRALNRLSTFVRSGAEDWILRGLPLSPDHAAHRRDLSSSTDNSDVTIGRVASQVEERHLVESGPSWVAQVPHFAVTVHSPSKRRSIAGLAEYTIYLIASTFPAAEGGNQSQQITVERRFSNFAALASILTKRLPGLGLPPLPEKQYSGRFADDFIELRRGDLERWLQRLIRHPVVRVDQCMIGFLGVESEETEWKEWKLLQPQLSDSHSGPHFYAHVFHPEYNIDIEDASETMDRFESHIASVNRGVQDLRTLWPRIREAQREISQVHRSLSYSILAMISDQVNADHGDNADGTYLSRTCNADGAWCWRDQCQDCIEVTRRLKRVADCLQEVADEEEDHANAALLDTHNMLKDVAYPSNVYAPVVETHKETLVRYQEASASEHKMQQDDVTSRCETVLNSTLAEVDVYHTQKGEDFIHLTKQYLDGEIAHHEVVLGQLRRARKVMEDRTHDVTLCRGEKLHPSIYERELANPRYARPLLQPSAHFWDSASLRPVTVVAEGVGALWNGFAGGKKSKVDTATDRGSVFGRFW